MLPLASKRIDMVTDIGIWIVSDLDELEFRSGYDDSFDMTHHDTLATDLHVS